MANEKRLIDANAVLKWLEEITEPTEWIVSQYNADWIWGMIDSQPTVEAVPVVHGRWEQRKILDWFGTKICFRCTECKTHWDANTNFCPNCGAKMDGGTSR